MHLMDRLDYGNTLIQDSGHDTFSRRPMAEKLDELAVIVVNYGSSGLLEANLLPLARSLPGAGVVVVDNRTSDTERSAVLALAARESWEIVAPATNTGFGGGMNLGVARARDRGASVFLLVNPDLSIPADSVLAMWEAVRADPLALVSPRVLRPDGTPWFTGADLYLEDGRIRSQQRRPLFEGARREPWLSGACLMVSADLWNRVGGFREEYFLYWEDVDLSHRVALAGGSLLICADATAVHAEGGTQSITAVSAGSRKSALYYFYNIRNRLLFACRNLPTADLLGWRRATVRVSWEILLQGGRRQLLLVWPLLAAVKGMAAGFAIVRRELRRRSAENGP